MIVFTVREECSDSDYHRSAEGDSSSCNLFNVMKSHLVQFKVTLDNIVHFYTQGEGNWSTYRVRMVVIFDCCVRVSLKALKNKEIPCKASDIEMFKLKNWRVISNKNILLSDPEHFRLYPNSDEEVFPKWLKLFPSNPSRLHDTPS